MYSLGAGGDEWLWLVVVFGLVTTIGVAGMLDSTRYIGVAFLITGTLAVFFAAGRALVYRVTEPLAVVLLLLGITALYRGYQYRQAV